MKKDNGIYIGHILEAINKIERFCGTLLKKDFLRNELIRDAVVRNIEIIGEASKRLSAEFRKQHADIPWKDISGMRDKIAHDYMGVDFRIVWDVVKKDLPGLKTRLGSLAKKS